MVLSHKRCVTGAWNLSQFAPKKKKKKQSRTKTIIHTDYNFVPTLNEY